MVTFFGNLYIQYIGQNLCECRAHGIFMGMHSSPSISEEQQEAIKSKHLNLQIITDPSVKRWKMWAF